MEANLVALVKRAQGSPALARYDTIARLLPGNVRALCQRLDIPPLSAYGLTPADIPTVVEKASRASSMKANPIALTTDELTGILTAAL